MKILGVIQARMGSSRLPGKILNQIKHKPMLWHIVNRLKEVKKLNDIIIATSKLKIDDPVFNMSEKYQINCFRGSEKNVLDRFYYAAKSNAANHIIRITGDCPLLDPKTIDMLVEKYFNGHYDYCGIACGAGAANKKNIKRFPDGLDAEIFKFEVLENAYTNATDKLSKEHVTPYIWKNSDKFKIGTLYSDMDYSSLRLTVDNLEDFELIEWIYNSLFDLNPKFDIRDVINLLLKNPKMVKNNHFLGKEGYDEFWK